MLDLDKIIEYLEQRGSITVNSKPPTWCSATGGKCGNRKVSYPYTLVAENFLITSEGSYLARVSVRDVNGYGWSLKPEYFQEGYMELESDTYEEIEI